MSFDKRYKRMKIIISVLLVSLAISLFFNFQFAKSLEDEEREYRTYVNHYYSEVRNIRLTLDDLLEGSLTRERLNEELIYLSQQLNRFSYISSKAPYYVSEVPASGINLFDKASSVILHGSNEYEEIPSFIQDPQLSDGERAYLEGIRAHILYIHNKLYSNETNQEKRDITKAEMNEVATYITEIISNHKELLEAYIKEMDSY